ncbi:TPA: ATP-binding cassette domain-containing protein, partial [Enterococcus faecium]
LSMKIDFLKVLQKKNLFFSQTKHSGEIQFRMFSDISTIVNTIFIFSVELPVIGVLVLVAVFIISKVNLIFLIFSLIMMGAMVLQYNLFQLPLKKTIENTKSVNQSITGELNAHFDQLEIISAYNFENISILKFDSRFKELFNVFKKQNKLLTLGSCLAQVIFQLWIGGIFLIDVILLAKGTISITNFVIVFMYANMVPTLWTTLISIIWKWQDYSVSLNRYYEYYSNNNKVAGTKKINKINSITGQSLNFSYNKRKVLSNISFSTEMNKLFMISGENGTGKTTLMKLFTKQLPVSNNQLFVNGIDINMIDNESLRRLISIATQIPYIINSSVKENILMGTKNYDKKKFSKLIELLGISKFMTKLGITLDDNIYDEKILLSGGEKQKISLARALIKSASVIILDEPFRNLDNETRDN